MSSIPRQKDFATDALELPFEALKFTDLKTPTTLEIFEICQSTQKECEGQKSALQAIRESSYYPIGCDPKATDLSTTGYKTADLVELLRFICSGDEEIHIIIADSALKQNIKAHNAKIGLNDSDSKKTSRTIAERDRLFIRAIIKYLQEDNFHIASPQIHIFSDLIDCDEFGLLKEKLEQILKEDLDNNGIHNRFAEKLWETIPIHFRKNQLGPAYSRKSPYELPDQKPNPNSNLTYKESGWAIMQYVLQQIAEVSFLGSKKIGHPGEKPYDDLVTWCHSQFPEVFSSTPSDNLKFNRVNVPNVTGNPYRTMSLKAQERGEPLLTIAKDITQLKTAEEPFDELYRFYCFEFRIFKIFLKQILEADLPEKMKREILFAEVEKIKNDLVTTLSTIPMFKYLFNADIPVSCPEIPHESDLGKELRYLCNMVGGLNGPISMKSEYYSYEIFNLLRSLYKDIEGHAIFFPRNPDETDEEYCFRYQKYSKYGNTRIDRMTELSLIGESAHLVKFLSPRGVLETKIDDNCWEIPFDDWCYSRFHDMPMYIDWESEFKNLNSIGICE